MTKEMLINVSEGEECRIALLDNGRLQELYMERASSTSHVGNVYKGRVTNVEPSIQAAFIDFGLGRNGFLHISDLMPTYFGKQGDDIQEIVGRKMARRDRPPIQRCLRRGDEIVVQIIKEGIGTKGPTLSTYISIPGRILVMMPGMAKMGVSRKIEDEVERRRLRQILDSLKPLDDVGFIIRTAGVGKSKTEIQRDLTYLTRLWQTFVKKRDSGSGPMELYTEGDLVSRTVRDFFSTDIDRVIVDNKEVAKRVKEVIKLANPRAKNKVELHEDPIPLFHQFGIEREIELIHSRHVPLPSGGSLVIDSTEAIVAIDVNSGKFRDHSDAEMTAFKTDMEAADEIPRQLRLRDLGGVIICDFIDLRYERNRRELEQRLHDNFQHDRAKTKVLRMSQFGIIEITRQRMRASLKRSIYFDCPHCKGAGLVKTPESMSLDVMRRLTIAMNDARVVRIELAVCPDVAFYLQNKKRQALVDLEARYNKRILIRSENTLALDEAKLDLFDAREGRVYLAELGMIPQPVPGEVLRQGPPRRDDRGRRQGGRPPQHRRPEPPREEDQHSIDRVEQEVEDREEDDAGQSPEAPAREEDQGPIEPAPPRREDQGRPPVDGDMPRRRRRRRGRGRGRGGRDMGGPPMGDGPRSARPSEFVGPPDGPEFDVPMDDVAELPEAPNAGPSEAHPVEPDGPPRRRRRRRGGRGRGRGRTMPADMANDMAGDRENDNGQPPAIVKPPLPKPVRAPEPEPEPEVEPGNEAEVEAVKTPRRRGPARPQRKPPVTSTPRTISSTPRAVSSARVQQAVVPTGSADRHLASDEPIAPLPPSRPRSVRDLDDIPDDFD